MAIFSKSFGKTQQKIGEVSGSIGKVFGTIGGIVMILIGIGICISAFVLKEPDDKKDKDKKRPYILLIPGIACILMGIFVIWFSFWWNKLVHTNKTAAQIGAVGMEIDLVSKLFR